VNDEDELPPAKLPFPITRTMPEPVELRAEGDTPAMLRGRFTTFDDPYEVNSHIEGHFIERIAPGAFDRTVVESRKNIKVLFNHGQDPTMGDQILGSIEELRSDAHFTVDPFDGIPPLIRSGLERGAYGASHRFSVIADEWTKTPEKTDANPDGIPERTITEARLYEFGPVTFPANPNATAGIRSTTDDFYQQGDYASVLRSAQAARTPAPSGGDGSPQTDAGLPRSPESDARKHVDPTPTPQELTIMEYISRDEKASRVTELESAISTRAVEYPGVFPADIQAADEAENEERNQLVLDIAAWDARQERIRSFSTIPAKTVAGSAPAFVKTPNIEDIHDITKIRAETRSREEYDTKVREYALRSIDSARLPSSANTDALVDLIAHRDAGEDGEGEMAQRILLTGSPAYKRAFAKYLRGEKDLWSPEEQRAAALAVTGTTTTGGFAVPYIFDPTMLHIGVYTAMNPYRSACRVETITNGNNWRTVTVGAVTSAYVAEAAAATEQGPTFGQPTYTVQRAHAFATVSIETLGDRPDISSELASVFAESKATLEEDKFTLGVGTTVFPFGMFTTLAYTNKDTATNDVTAIADIVALEGDLPLRHRANGAFFMSRSTIRQLQALDTTFRFFSGAGIQYAGDSNPSHGTGNTGLQLLGYPVWEVPSAVSTLTTDGAIIVVFADPKSYVIVDRLGMNVEVIPHILNGATPSLPTGERGIYAYWRNTAKPINADAGRSLSVQ